MTRESEGFHFPIEQQTAPDMIRFGRVWSLWEMINFEIDALRAILDEIGIHIHQACVNADAIARMPGGHKNTTVINDRKYQQTLANTKDAVKQTVKMTKHGLRYLNCPHIDHAADALGWWANGDTQNWEDLRGRACTLRDAINVEMKQYLYYQYPKDKAQMFRDWEDTWGPSLKAFKSIRKNAFCAVDCFALGHDNACIFHCMQVLEVGLHALADNVEFEFTVQTWGAAINQISGKITGMERNGIPGLDKQAKDERLQFLSAAVAEFRHFEYAWRNYSAHGKADYDEHDAARVLTHTRTFMNHLALRLSEAP